MADPLAVFAGEGGGDPPPCRAEEEGGVLPQNQPRPADGGAARESFSGSEECDPVRKDQMPRHAAAVSSPLYFSLPLPLFPCSAPSQLPPVSALSGLVSTAEDFAAWGVSLESLAAATFRASLLELMHTAYLPSRPRLMWRRVKRRLRADAGCWRAAEADGSCAPDACGGRNRLEGDLFDAKNSLNPSTSWMASHSAKSESSDGGAGVRDDAHRDGLHQTDENVDPWARHDRRRVTETDRRRELLMEDVCSRFFLWFYVDVSRKLITDGLSLARRTLPVDWVYRHYGTFLSLPECHFDIYPQYCIPMAQENSASSVGDFEMDGDAAFDRRATASSSSGSDLSDTADDGLEEEAEELGLDKAVELASGSLQGAPTGPQNSTCLGDEAPGESDVRASEVALERRAGAGGTQTSGIRSQLSAVSVAADVLRAEPGDADSLHDAPDASLSRPAARGLAASTRSPRAAAPSSPFVRAEAGGLPAAQKEPALSHAGAPSPRGVVPAEQRSASSSPCLFRTCQTPEAADAFDDICNGDGDAAHGPAGPAHVSSSQNSASLLSGAAYRAENDNRKRGDRGPSGHASNPPQASSSRAAHAKGGTAAAVEAPQEEAEGEGVDAAEEEAGGVASAPSPGDGLGPKTHPSGEKDDFLVVLSEGEDEASARIQMLAATMRRSLQEKVQLLLDEEEEDSKAVTARVSDEERSLHSGDERDSLREAEEMPRSRTSSAASSSHRKGSAAGSAAPSDEDQGESAKASGAEEEEAIQEGECGSTDHEMNEARDDVEASEKAEVAERAAEARRSADGGSQARHSDSNDGKTEEPAYKTKTSRRARRRGRGSVPLSGTRKSSRLNPKFRENAETCEVEEGSDAALSDAGGRREGEAFESAAERSAALPPKTEATAGAEDSRETRGAPATRMPAHRASARKSAERKSVESEPRAETSEGEFHVEEEARVEPNEHPRKRRRRRRSRRSRRGDLANIQESEHEPDRRAPSEEETGGDHDPGKDERNDLPPERAPRETGEEDGESGMLVDEAPEERGRQRCPAEAASEEEASEEPRATTKQRRRRAKSVGRPKSKKRMSAGSRASSRGASRTKEFRGALRKKDIDASRDIGAQDVDVGLSDNSVYGDNGSDADDAESSCDLPDSSEASRNLVSFAASAPNEEKGTSVESEEATRLHAAGVGDEDKGEEDSAASSTEPRRSSFLSRLSSEVQTTSLSAHAGGQEAGTVLKASALQVQMAAIFGPSRAPQATSGGDRFAVASPLGGDRRREAVERDRRRLSHLGGGGSALIDLWSQQYEQDQAERPDSPQPESATDEEEAVTTPPLSSLHADGEIAAAGDERRGDPEEASRKRSAHAETPRRSRGVERGAETKRGEDREAKMGGARKNEPKGPSVETRIPTFRGRFLWSRPGRFLSENKSFARRFLESVDARLEAIEAQLAATKTASETRPPVWGRSPSLSLRAPTASEQRGGRGVRNLPGFPFQRSRAVDSGVAQGTGPGARLFHPHASVAAADRRAADFETSGDEALEGRRGLRVDTTQTEELEEDSREGGAAISDASADSRSDSDTAEETEDARRRGRHGGGEAAGPSSGVCQSKALASDSEEDAPAAAASDADQQPPPGSCEDAAPHARRFIRAGLRRQPAPSARPGARRQAVGALSHPSPRDRAPAEPRGRDQQGLPRGKQPTPLAPSGAAGSSSRGLPPSAETHRAPRGFSAAAARADSTPPRRAARFGIPTGAAHHAQLRAASADMHAHPRLERKTPLRRAAEAPWPRREPPLPRVALLASQRQREKLELPKKTPVQSLTPAKAPATPGIARRPGASRHFQAAGKLSVGNPGGK
ncbi:hypothetical protein BESB_028960 [Besnoitia besnoiti]|uniref:Uncharacterized protein n=1 Tax=Besnoitia besnoiti TaxID=94643 RepID=A0A2A9M581_BESBE|nr:uncharacterized protein BESB_028960 [Besnoitia besnoiti]PFH31461.1 hypothetical protein BESB_028960 [Besnoitia besnoiti]